jgi:hypothetical protein
MEIEHKYYMGKIESDNRLFNTKIDKSRWDSIKHKLELSEKPSTSHLLKYYTHDSIYIVNISNNTTILAHTPTITCMTQPECLSVKTHLTTLPFFPVQYEYFNKQRHNVYKFTQYNGIVLSEIFENHQTFYEIYGFSTDSIKSISAFSASASVSVSASTSSSSSSSSPSASSSSSSP